MCPSGAKGYYEIKVLAKDRVSMYGFASMGFKQGQLVGDDVHSWSVEGNGHKRHNNHSPKIELNLRSLRHGCLLGWQTGDVIGLACDLVAMQMHVSVNGNFDPPNGVVFDLEPQSVHHGLFAAFSCEFGPVQYNLGESPFRHAPPSVDYKAFVDFGTEDEFEGACIRKELDMVQVLARCNADINSIETSIREGLMVEAIASNRGEIVKLLAHSDLCLDFTDTRGWTVLDMSEGKEDIFETLRAAGAQHSIFYAIDERRLDVLKSLVAAGAHGAVKNKEDKIGILLAIERGYSEAARMLIEPTACSGLLGSLTDEAGRSCLMLASSHRLASAVQDLLMAGARPEHVDNQKRTSLMLALLAYKNQGCEHVGVTCDNCHLCPILGNRFKCAVCRDFDLCERCYAEGAHSDESHVFCLIDRVGLPGQKLGLEDRGRVAQQRAPREEVVSILIEPTQKAGGLDLQDCNGMSCLMMASEQGLGDTVQRLLTAGVKVDLTNAQGFTALMLACSNGHEDVASVLVSPTQTAGALELRCSNGHSAFLWAKQMGLVRVMEKLRMCGVAHELIHPAILSGKLQRVQLNAKERVVVIHKAEDEHWGLNSHVLNHSFDAASACLAQRISFREIVDLRAKLYKEDGFFSTVRSNQRCPVGARGYYEIEILKSVSPSFGFCTAAFGYKAGMSSQDQLLGEDEKSWSISWLFFYSIQEA